MGSPVGVGVAAAMTKFNSEAIAALFTEVREDPAWRWRIGGSHIVCYPPDGSRPLILSTTAYDGPATRTTIGQFRRHGLEKR